MIIEGHDLIDKYRRLRILYNRIMLFGEHPFYSYWTAYVFQTNLGPRRFVCTVINTNTSEEVMEFYYEEESVVLFKIEINKKRYNFEGYLMNEEQAWLAIHELEELSYKELDKLYEQTAEVERQFLKINLME